MKLQIIFLSIVLVSSVYAQTASKDSQVLQSLACKVSFGFFKGSKLTDMQVTITQGDLSTTLPSFPQADVTLTLSSMGSETTEKLPTATVGYVYAQPPFSQFSVVGYILTWKDGASSELNLICQTNGTCTGSGVLQKQPQKVITCNDVTATK